MSNAGNDSPRTSRSTGRRGLLRAAAGGALVAATAAAVVPRRKALAQSPLPARALAIMNGPKYRISRWFLYFAEATTGEMLYALNEDELVLPASVTKLWATATALDAYGPDYRFETPIYKRGAVDSAGTLDGDLILVASGDLTMGGRNTPQGTIAFTSFDHIYANTVPGATLTPENPLAGLDELAQQVAAAGIRRVRDVLIDARLFEQYPKDDYILSPIMINDNLIDLTVVPGAAGQTATVEWRPQTAAYTVQSQVRTVAAGGAAAITATLPRPGVIVVEGTIPAGGGTVLHTAQVADPPAFARTLLIEALGRAGVTTDAAPLGPNPAAQLPPSGSYVAADRVALLTSLPFSQNIRLINKVSLNQGADTLIMLLAVKNGQRTFDAGMTRILPFIQQTGIDSDLISLSDGRGGPGEADLFSMRTVTRLLRYMTTRPDFPAYYDSLPVFGEVGSEVDTVPPTSPLKGKAHAKSGTLVGADLLHQSLMVTSRGNAGYMTSKSGREIAFGLYVMYAPIKTIEDIFATLADVGDAVEAFYEVT